jgi:transposase
MEGFNKSDWNDARGIAQMMRVNLFRPGHGKTTSQKRRARLNRPEAVAGQGHRHRE